MIHLVFDLDDTICDTHYHNSEFIYELARPKQEIIDKINGLYNKGYHITIYTARGSSSGINWYDLTKSQLDSWGVKYHKLLTNKPMGDVYIDDKSITPEQFIEKEW